MKTITSHVSKRSQSNLDSGYFIYLFTSRKATASGAGTAKPRPREDQAQPGESFWTSAPVSVIITAWAKSQDFILSRATITHISPQTFRQFSYRVGETLVISHVVQQRTVDAFFGRPTSSVGESGVTWSADRRRWDKCYISPSAILRRSDCPRYDSWMNEWVWASVLSPTSGSVDGNAIAELCNYGYFAATEETGVSSYSMSLFMS